MTPNASEDAVNSVSVFVHSLMTGGVVAVIAGIIPPIVGLLAIVFYSITIYESRTIQHWLRNHQMKVKAKKLMKLRSKAKVVAAEIEALELVRVARVAAREKVAAAEATATVEEANHEPKP